MLSGFLSARTNSSAEYGEELLKLGHLRHRDGLPPKLVIGSGDQAGPGQEAIRKPTHNYPEEPPDAMSSTAADRAAFTPCANDRVVVSRFIAMWWDGIPWCGLLERGHGSVRGSVALCCTRRAAGAARVVVSVADLPPSDWTAPG